jgi:hypothetical protein
MRASIEVIFAESSAREIPNALEWLTEQRSAEPTFSMDDLDLLFCPDKNGYEALVDNVNALLVSSPRPRSTLLLRSEDINAIHYGLLRRLQDKNWKIGILANTDHLVGSLTEQGSVGLRALERALELATKFRIEIDFLHTLPTRFVSADDACRLFEFHAARNTRMVSFRHQLLLNDLGVASKSVTAEEAVVPFTSAFLDLWIRRRDVFALEDLETLCAVLESRRAYCAGGTAGEKDTAFFVSHGEMFAGVESSVEGCKVADWTLMPAPQKRGGCQTEMCRSSCEYYDVCGGAYRSERYLYNGTLSSAQNLYCRSIVMSGIDHILANGSHA